jgi:hypothetical protein
MAAAAGSYSQVDSNRAPASFEVVDLPLNDVLRRLAERYAVRIDVISGEHDRVLVTARVNDADVYQALKVVLRPFNYALVPVADGALRVYLYGEAGEPAAVEPVVAAGFGAHPYPNVVPGYKMVRVPSGLDGLPEYFQEPSDEHLSATYRETLQEGGPDGAPELIRVPRTDTDPDSPHYHREVPPDH